MIVLPPIYPSCFFVYSYNYGKGQILSVLKLKNLKHLNGYNYHTTFKDLKSGMQI